MVHASRGEESVTMTCTILRIEPPKLLEHTHADASYLRWEQAHYASIGLAPPVVAS
jgi:hypothetical protein